MEKEHIFVDINEASKVVMKFIGTDKFYQVVDALENNAQSGFTAGLSFALCLILAECPNIIYRESPQKSSD